MARQAKGPKKPKKPSKKGPLSVAVIVAVPPAPPPAPPPVARPRVNWQARLQLPAVPVVVPPAPVGPRPELPPHAPANSTATARRTATTARAVALAAQDVWDTQQLAHDNAVAYNNGQRRSGRVTAKPKRLIDEKE